jgi:Kef-type K+ transport system membrane component KefB
MPIPAGRQRQEGTDVLDGLGRVLAEAMGAHGGATPASATSFAPSDMSVHFFLQLGVILVACRAMGWLCTRFLRQPAVVGEMVAGVLLGPSLLGLVAPSLQAAIFPQETRGLLYAGAQLGVGLYMFLVGSSLRLDQLRSRARSAAAVSAAGIAVPFAAAVPLAPLLLAVPGLFGAEVGRGSATLFLGACMALTAFPMLARIIAERGLAGSPLGALSLTAGAFDDACSWCVLAIVLAITGSGAAPAILAIGGGLAWAVLVVLVGPRLLAPVARSVEQRGEMTPAALATVLAGFCVSAFLMDLVGIHAIFGGFILGVVMPRGLLADELKRKLEPMTLVLLLPMFFTYSGLNTRLDLVTTGPLLLIALGILAVSVLAKGGACYVAARLSGENHRTGLAIGALMNARGLMELIIINIGLQKGLIGPTLFSVLVLMAIATTVMASPLFELSQRAPERRRDGTRPMVRATETGRG